MTGETVTESQTDNSRRGERQLLMNPTLRLQQAYRRQRIAARAWQSPSAESEP
jgi:hypothetical protein